MDKDLEKEWITKAGLTARIYYLGANVSVKVAARMKPWRCGYIRLPDNSQFRGRDYDDYSCIVVMGSDDQIDDGIQVHEGLTYAGDLGISNGWWFGFDCAHPGDDNRHWTLKRVQAECENLAAQMHRREEFN